jgi:hypothetical protein
MKKSPLKIVDLQKITKKIISRKKGFCKVSITKAIEVLSQHIIKLEQEIYFKDIEIERLKKEVQK